MRDGWSCRAPGLGARRGRIPTPPPRAYSRLVDVKALVRDRLLTVAEYIGLLAISVATVVAMVQEILVMVQAGVVGLGDLLLMFIYLEVLTMVGLYLKSGKLPVRIPLYIGVVALARYLVLDVKSMDGWRMLAVSAAVLLLALAVCLRFVTDMCAIPTTGGTGHEKRLRFEQI